MTTLHQREAETGTVKNLLSRNKRIRDGAIAASRDVFDRKTDGLRRGHPTYDREMRAHNRRVDQIRSQYPDRI